MIAPDPAIGDYVVTVRPTYAAAELLPPGSVGLVTAVRLLDSGRASCFQLTTLSFPNGLVAHECEPARFRPLSALELLAAIKLPT